MPTDLDNAKLMFLCLKFSTATTFDYKKIGEECKISTGAASKRMSRLKQAVKEGKENGLDVRYLWSCIQHSDMNNVDFKAVGEELSLNAGAASKRWSRLKMALERGETGSTTAAAPGGKQGNGSNGKKSATSNRKRQNAETADNEGDDAGAFKKAKRNPSTRKVKTEEHNDDDGNDAAETYESDDTAEGIVIPGLDKKPTTIVKKSAPALSQMAATTDGPVKTSTFLFTAAPDSPPSPASAPPRRRRGRRPLTEEEVYRKLDVDEAEEHARRSMGGATSRTYPKSHNLRDTFASMRTPDGKQGGGATANAFDDVAIPGENDDDADGSSVPPGRYSTPENNNNSASPPKQQQKKKHTVNEVFAAIADEAMKSPSGAEERQRMKQIKEAERESNGGSKSRVATPTNPMTPATATFAANNADDANQPSLANVSVNIGNNGGGRLSGGSAGGNDDWYRVPQNLPNPFFGPPLGESLGDDESSFFKDAMGDDVEYI
ncbi:hypothetical protein DIS24_g8225 [Lasiodiplodia hormozganensis]|uniref:Myb-like DNA-binding domain-containing protein n=1 Tax=Lasiodiplodia hormozganensis TaxID=869390 RepID=A0AA39Y480_9PEZI|nr:hypothetical protein DIS24_g8225 [Lasiodiplodia hormozganensis]